MNPVIEAAREGRFILLLGALVAFGPLSIDLYLPALPAIASGRRDDAILSARKVASSSQALRL